MVAFFKSHFIRLEMHMDGPDKSENIFGIWYQLSKHLTFYVSSLISTRRSKTNICLFSAPSIEHNANNWSWKQTNVSFEAFLVGNQGCHIKGQMLR